VKSQHFHYHGYNAIKSVSFASRHSQYWNVKRRPLRGHPWCWRSKYEDYLLILLEGEGGGFTRAAAVASPELFRWMFSPTKLKLGGPGRRASFSSTIFRTATLLEETVGHDFLPPSGHVDDAVMSLSRQDKEAVRFWPYANRLSAGYTRTYPT